MKNFLKSGKILTLVAPAAVVSGQPVLIGNIFGVCIHDAASGADVEVQTEGEVELNKDTNLVISAGDRLFWDAANAWLDKTVTAQVNVASATKDAAQAATTVRCKLGSSTPAGT